MAWTAPRTWVTAEVVTASIMNTHVRDDLLETAPAKAAAAGGLIVTTGANSIAARLMATDTVATSQTTTSTSYTDLATAGPDLTTLATGTTALILWSAFVRNDTSGAETFVSIAVSGASTVSAADTIALRHETAGANQYARLSMWHYFTGLTAGGNTFTMKYKVDAGTGTFANRSIAGFSLS